MLPGIPHLLEMMKRVMVGILVGTFSSFPQDILQVFSVDNKCYHDSANTKGWVYPMQPLQISNGQRDQQQITSFQTPEKIYCILDMDEGKMSFATDTSFLGTAFCGLKGKKLYPAVSAVWGHCEVTIRYIGGLDRKLQLFFTNFFKKVEFLAQVCELKTFI